MALRTCPGVIGSDATRAPSGASASLTAFSTAAARGRKGGRKPVVTSDKLQRAREHIANGLNVREAAARLKISKTALYAALQAVSAADS